MGFRRAPRVVWRRRHDLHARPACDQALGLLLKALAILLVGLALVAAIPVPSAELLKTGKQVYDVNCAACHGVSGQGDGPVAFAIKPPPRNLAKDPFKAGDNVEQIFNTISNGLPNTKMVGYPTIKEPDRWAVAFYVRAFRIKK